MRRDQYPDKPCRNGSGLPIPSKRGALYLLDEDIDAPKEVSVSALPIEILLPRMLREHEVHSINSRSVPPRDSSSAMDAEESSGIFGAS